MTASAYCSQADIESRISTLGVSLRIDDGSGAAAIAMITDCINDASEWVNFYCGQRYTPEVLATSQWVKYRTRDIAIFNLCFRRLNAIPKSVQLALDLCNKALEAVQLGKVVIPGLATRKSAAPVLSQPRVIMFPYPYTAIERNRSTGTPAGYTQRNDPFETPVLP